MNSGKSPVWWRPPLVGRIFWFLITHPGCLPTLDLYACLDALDCDPKSRPDHLMLGRGRNQKIEGKLSNKKMDRQTK